MFDVSPYRVAAFLAMAGVLVLVGWNSLRSEGVQDREVIADRSPRAAETGPGSGVKSQPGSTDGAAGLDLAAGDRRIVVDVSGAVRRPGVYRFDHGQRVIDAIRRAGGATRGAFSAGINRAALLADGQQVVVPAPAAAAAGPGAEVGSVTGAPGAAADAPISLGTATQEQLEGIEGIGPVTAQSILEFRDSQGGISSVDELDEVSGIGPVTMEALRSRLQP